MTKILILAIISTLACVYTSCDKTAEKDKNLNNSTLLTNKSGVDQEATNFIKVASLSSIMEIEYGKVAQQKANSAAVKSFAQIMITDHTKIYNEMKKLATDKKILLPIKMEQGQADSLVQIQTLHGSEFDRTYMRIMVSGHQKAIKSFEQGSQNRDAAINTFATGNIKVLKKHLNSAIATYNELNRRS